MAYEQKENAGSLFKNDKKESEKHPDYKGTVKIGGIEYWQSAWIKETNGKKWMSQSFTPKVAVVNEAIPEVKAPLADLAPNDGDLPF